MNEQTRRWTESLSKSPQENLVNDILRKVSVLELEIQKTVEKIENQKTKDADSVEDEEVNLSYIGHNLHGYFVRVGEYVRRAADRFHKEEQRRFADTTK